MYKYLFLLPLLFGTVSLAAQTPEYGGYVKYAASTPGTITVISNGFGKKMRESGKDANAGAFYAVLFRGIADSRYQLPLVSDEAGKKNDPIVTGLLTGGYGSFVIEDILVSQEAQTRKVDGSKGILTVHKITIDYDALRKYLEQNGVIRKFGY